MKTDREIDSALKAVLADERGVPAWRSTPLHEFPSGEVDINSWPKGKYGWDFEGWVTHLLEVSKKGPDVILRFKNYDEGKAEGDELAVVAPRGKLKLKEAEGKVDSMTGAHGISTWTEFDLSTFDGVMQQIAKVWNLSYDILEDADRGSPESGKAALTLVKGLPPSDGWNLYGESVWGKYL